MLTIETIREQESNNKWKELIHLLGQSSEEAKSQDSDELSNKLYERITLDIFHIEKIDEILKSDAIQYFPDKKQELVLEKDELRIKASSNFLGYLLSQKTIELDRKIDNFLLGAECICTTLVHSGETLYSLDKKTILFLIKNLHTALEIWKKFSPKIENESIWLVHEKSLKSIYSSLYILEDTYRYLVGDRNSKNRHEQENDWVKEESWSTLFDSLEQFSDDFMSDRSLKDTATHDAELVPWDVDGVYI